jgi:hypothetical protein
MYLKITNENENHHGLQYHDGLIIDPIPFAKEGSCVTGGIYFTTPEFICEFINMGIYLREVTIPEDAEIVKDPGGDKWRASKVILSPRKELKDIETWKYLVELGANIHVRDDYALRVASSNGHLEVVKYLVELGANIHAQDDYALRYASSNGQLEVVKYLVELGANIHARDDYALRYASSNGQLEVVKYLVEIGANIHAQNDAALRYASEMGHLEVVKYLESIVVEVQII